MIWTVTNRNDPASRELADRHYNRQSIGAPGFVPPGRCLVLKAEGALWVTSWPYAAYVKHAWAGAWMNSLFRRESGDVKASEMIRQAIAATRWNWPEVPEQGVVTFVDADQVKHKRDPGRCYRKAGFRHVGFTKAGLWAFQMRLEDMPEACAPLGSQARMF